MKVVVTIDGTEFHQRPSSLNNRAQLPHLAPSLGHFFRPMINRRGRWGVEDFSQHDEIHKAFSEAQRKANELGRPVEINPCTYIAEPAKLVEFFEGVSQISASNFDISATHIWQPFDVDVTETLNDDANNLALVGESGGITGFSNGRAENFGESSINPDGSPLGYISTMTNAEFQAAESHSNVPGIDNSRVGVLKADGQGFQTDFYMHAGDANGIDDNIPGVTWLQFWMFFPSTADLTNYHPRPCKFFYPSNDGWASNDKMWRLDTYTTDVDGPLLFIIRDQETGTILWTDARDPSLEGRCYQNLDETVGVNKGVWSLVKIHIDTTNASIGNTFEVWRRTYGTEAWTKTAEYISGTTPNLTWTIPSTATSPGGHSGGRLLTTFPANNPTTKPSQSLTLYMKDFCIADDETKLYDYWANKGY